MPLPDLQLFPCGREVFGLAAGLDWGRIQCAEVGQAAHPSAPLML